MKTIQTTAIVQPDGTIVLKAPPGEHQVVLVIEERVRNGQQSLDDFPVNDLGPWPEHLSLRREDLYGEWGR